MAAIRLPFLTQRRCATARPHGFGSAESVRACTSRATTLCAYYRLCGCPVRHRAYSCPATGTRRLLATSLVALVRGLSAPLFGTAHYLKAQVSIRVRVSWRSVLLLVLFFFFFVAPLPIGANITMARLTARCSRALRFRRDRHTFARAPRAAVDA